MFSVVNKVDNLYYVLDSDDGVIEPYTVGQLKHIVKDLGITIVGVYVEKDGNYNEYFTPNGVSVTLNYKNKKLFGKWCVVVLESGDKYGSKLETIATKPLVMFYDMDAITKHKWDRNKYPYGQFVSSYNLETILGINLGLHHGLSLDASVPSWGVDYKDLVDIVTWLEGLDVH